MNPIAKMVKFTFNVFIAIVALLCAAWWTAFFYLLSVYGPLGGVVLILWTIMIPVIVCGISHSHHNYDRKCECDHR